MIVSSYSQKDISRFEKLVAKCSLMYINYDSYSNDRTIVHSWFPCRKNRQCTHIKEIILTILTYWDSLDFSMDFYMDTIQYYFDSAY